MSTEEGIKNDHEKIQLELLSPTWILGVGSVLTFGAKKYAAHNWRKGIQRSRLLGATLRHVLAYMGGEDLDPESGLSHLYHASCCLMFAAELHQTRPDLDDRYQSTALHDADARLYGVRSSTYELAKVACETSGMTTAEIEQRWKIMKANERRRAEADMKSKPPESLL